MLSSEKTKIQLKREEAGMSRAELSRQSGVPIRTLEAWEYKVNLPRDVYQLARISKVIGCLIEDLIDSTEQ